MTGKQKVEADLEQIQEEVIWARQDEEDARDRAEQLEQEEFEMKERLGEYEEEDG